MIDQHISTSSLESEDSPLRHTGQDSELSDSVRLSHLPVESLSGIGPSFQILETCEESAEQRPDWSLEDHPASLPVTPGSEEAQRMTVGSGQRLLPLLNTASARRSVLKTLLASFLSGPVWTSSERFLRWKASATPWNRLLFRLVASTPNLCLEINANHMTPPISENSSSLPEQEARPKLQ